jgi:hypothetical protein
VFLVFLQLLVLVLVLLEFQVWVDRGEYTS